MMYSTPSFNDPMTGYYGNSLDYQSNLINGVNSNIYSNVNSSIKHSPPSHSPLSEDEHSLKRKRNKVHRNSRKVMIEKKRRDRINSCLDELRKLVPAANEKQGSAKLEKAEILQLTVDHLKNLHAKGFDTFSFDPHNFATKHLVMGFRECAEQVTRHLTSSEGFAFNEPLKSRLVNHLQRYITQREYDLKSNGSNGLASWNPNLFLIPPTTLSNNNNNQTNTSSNNVNTTTPTPNSTNGHQMTNSLSPITTLTHSSLSSHSNSSNNSSSYRQQTLNQHNDSTPTSPLCESPNNSLNNSSQQQLTNQITTSQLTASQLLNQHSYTDNNNNSSTNTSSQTNNNNNTSSHHQSDATTNSSSNQTSSQSSNVSNAINNAINSINNTNDHNTDLQNANLLLMGPPPPRPFKVEVTLPLPSSNTPATELTYTNMHPSTNGYSSHHHHHHHHSLNTNGYATNTLSNSLSNSYVAAVAHHHSNQIHHTQYLNNHSLPNFGSPFAYGTSMSAGASAVVANVVSSLPNTSTQSTAGNQLSNQFRPWGSDSIQCKIAY